MPLAPSKSQYSLASTDVTPAALDLWSTLPDEVRQDPSMGAFQRCYVRGRESNPPAFCADATFIDDDEDGEQIPMTNNNEERNGGKTLEDKCLHIDDVAIKKKEDLWSRGARYAKITLMLCCWGFYTSILVLYEDTKLVERHAALAAGEVKSFELTSNSASLRVWVGVNGPFWSQQRQDKNINQSDTSYMQMWLERERLDGNGSKEMDDIDKSEPYLVYLLEDDLLDLTEGEARSTVLQIFDSTTVHEGTYRYHIKMSHNGNGTIINRTVAAMISSTSALAVLALVGGRPTPNELLTWIDAETLLLLFSMMIIVQMLAETGVFDYLAVKAFERTRGETWPLINMMILLTIVVSLFLDNVTTVLLLTPATIRLCEVTNLRPVPVLLGVVVFCNVGGTATPVGDPPNIIIANNPAVVNAGINFANFTVHMSVCVFLVFIQTYIQFRFMFRDDSKLRMEDSSETQEIRQQMSAWKRACSSLCEATPEQTLVKKVLQKKLKVLEGRLKKSKRSKTALPPECFEETLKGLQEKYKIRDMKLLVHTLVAVAVVVVLFFMHSHPRLQGLSLGWSALAGALLALSLSGAPDVAALLARLDWATLLFFAPLFVFMEAITRLGLIQWIGGMTEDLILAVSPQYQLPVAILLVLWVSGVTSSLVDNIPLTSMMVRVVTSLRLALPFPPLVWALAAGACMGGNGTLVGASANVITAGIAEQHNYKITFKEFFKVGAPITIGHLVTVSVYLLVSHCVFTWH